MKLPVLFKTIMSCCLFILTFTACDKDDNTTILKFTPSKADIMVDSTISVTIHGGTEPYTVLSSNVELATATVAKNVMTITGIKAGVATITVTDVNKISEKLTVTIKATELSFDKGSINLDVEKEDIITIKDGTAPYVVESKDNTIANATEKDGKITVKGLKIGTTTITVVDKEKKSGVITVVVK